MLADISLNAMRDGRAYAECLHCGEEIGVVPVGQLRNEHGSGADSLVRLALDKLAAEHDCPESHS
jgi:hypothetical protein